MRRFWQSKSNFEAHTHSCSFPVDFDVSYLEKASLVESRIFLDCQSPVHGNIIFQLVNRTEPKERVNEGDNTWILFWSAKFAHSPIVVVVHWWRSYISSCWNGSFCQRSKNKSKWFTPPDRAKKKHMHLIENGIIQWAKQCDFVVVNLARSDTLNYVICFFTICFYFSLFLFWSLLFFLPMEIIKIALFICVSVWIFR